MKIYLLEMNRDRGKIIRDFLASEYSADVIIRDDIPSLKESVPATRIILISKHHPGFEKVVMKTENRSKNNEIRIVALLSSNDQLTDEQIDRIDFILRDPVRTEDLKLLRKHILKSGNVNPVSSQLLEKPEENYLLNYLFEKIPDAIFFKDDQFRYLKVNQTQAAFLGVHSPEEVVGKSDMDFLPQNQALESLNDDKHVLETGQPIVDKLERGIDVVGRYRWFATTKLPFYGPKGKLTGILGISREDTTQVETNLKLQHEKNILQVLMDNIPDSICIKDLNSRFIRVNKAFAQKLGLSSPKDAIGKTDFDFFETSHIEQIYNDEQVIINTGRSILNKTEAVRLPDGQLCWMQTTRFPYKNETGSISGIVGVSHDITDHEAKCKSLSYAKQKAEEANQSKSQFLANMSHEIRTPMNGVIGMADILKRTNLSPQQEEYVDIILRSGNNLIDIINAILDFSKIESGKIVLENIPFSVRNIIEEIGDLLSSKARKKGINLATYIEPDVPEMVKGDPVRLKQILLNLVNNGIQFTNEGDVVVNVKLNETTQGKHEIYFEVIDSGIGIPDEAQPFLFDSFTQVDSSTARNFGGSGLGLAISKRLTEQMGGEIGVVSNVNSGSKFWFTSIFDAESVENSNPTILHGKDFSKLKLLIIDDNRINRKIFTSYFKIWKCRYEEAASAAEGIEKMKEEQEKGKPFDMVLVDYHMGKMDGLSFARHILKDSAIQRVPLALLSSECELIPKHEFEALGISGALNKPLKLQQLYNLLMTLLAALETNRKNLEKQDDPYSFVGMDLKVLVVEDNPINSKVAVIALKDYAGKIEVAENGQQAVDLCKRNKYDVILMDLHMPVMNGYEATKIIRELEEKVPGNERIPIIAMTANILKDDMEECMKIGMDAFLSKPFCVNDMLSVLADLEVTLDLGDPV